MSTNDMQKSNNRQKIRHTKHREITEPILQKMSDEELKSVFLQVRSLINKGKRQKKNVRSKEIEMCCIQREMQDRKLYTK